MGCILASRFAKVAQESISNEIDLYVNYYHPSGLRMEGIIVRAIQRTGRYKRENEKGRSRESMEGGSWVCVYILRKAVRQKLHYATTVRSKQQHVKSKDIAWHRRSWPRGRAGGSWEGDRILHKCQVLAERSYLNKLMVAVHWYFPCVARVKHLCIIIWRHLIRRVELGSKNFTVVIGKKAHYLEISG